MNAQSSHEAEFTPEKTLRALRLQLAELRRIKNLGKDQATYREHEGWTPVTRAFIVRGFPKGSQALMDFDFASLAKRNRNQYEDFQMISDKHETVLVGLIQELEFVIPESENQGLYGVGEEFAFYKDLKDIVAAAKQYVFIVDNYLDRDVFELYVDPIPLGVDARILTDQVRGNLQSVATKYSVRGKFEFRSSKEVHDRHVFVDGRGWIIGQSIKDAAKKKPTYMIELDSIRAPENQSTYDSIWARANLVVKG